MCRLINEAPADTVHGGKLHNWNNPGLFNDRKVTVTGLLCTWERVTILLTRELENASFKNARTYVSGKRLTMASLHMILVHIYV